MTAIIGILNKATVAIAADSAATVSNGTKAKVYNHAHKIFNLSKDAPIGISIYNSAEFMGIPWETLIKIYRSDADSVAMSDLFEYGPHFLDFLKRFLSKISAADEQQTVAQITMFIVKQLWQAFTQRVNFDELLSKTKEERSQTFNIASDKHIIPLMRRYICSSDILDDFIVYEKAEFLIGFAETVEETATGYFREETAVDLDDNVISSIVDLVYEAVRRKELYESYTGVVFAGFGTDDLFPKLMSYRIGGVVNSTIRYTIDDDSVKITNTTSAAIKPFAQTDIIESFLTGIDPNIRSNLPELFSEAINEITAKIMEKLPQEHAHIKAAIDKTKNSLLDELSNSFSVKLANQFIHNNYFPILATIGTLSKEDLAEMAESLINLTYLKRRFTFADESVGGPVDIAIITKGDGFVWIKRKHYFNPEINLHYLASVLNNNNK